MDLNIRQTGDYTYILFPFTNLSYENIDKINSLLEDLADEAKGMITIDCKNLESLDSKGLGLIVNLHKQCLSCGGRLALLNVSDEAMYIFNITGFNNILKFITAESELLKIVQETA